MTTQPAHKIRDSVLQVSGAGEESTADSVIGPGKSFSEGSNKRRGLDKVDGVVTSAAKLDAGTR